MNDKKSKTLFYVIIAIVVLLVIYWLFAIDFGGAPGEEVTEIAPGETLRTAQEGQLVSGFPSEMILEEGVVASESYSINYSDNNTDQPVARYSSSLSLEQNIELYGSYLRANNWEITHEASVEDAPVTFFYARKNNRDVNITFNVRNDGVEVTIALAVREMADTATEDTDTTENTETESE